MKAGHGQALLESAFNGSPSYTAMVTMAVSADWVDMG